MDTTTVLHNRFCFSWFGRRFYANRVVAFVLTHIDRKLTTFLTLIILHLRTK